jgi:nitrogen fixation/metabolism regulation signal transduction histidine kinase
MISKRLYLNIILRVSLIVILSVLLGYIIASDQSLRFLLICLIIIISLAINLISYLNRTNRKISFFFDSVRNDDSSLSFPLDEKNSSIREIYKGMDKVNQQIKKLKIENRSQEQYFQILLEHLAAGIITFNDKGFIIHANSSAKNLLGTDVLTHLKQIERIDQKLFQAIDTIKPSERRLIAITTELGEIQLSLKATSFKTNNSELVILSIQDIKSELDEKEIESWMKLIRVLMHEIMNSITPITSLSESLFHIYSPDGDPILPDNVSDKTIATTLQGLNVIKEQGKGLMSFVESYRKLTRVPEPEKKIFKVAELVNRVLVLYHSLEKSDLTQLSVSTIDQDLEMYADENLISQVLINLLKNALEANENNSESRIVITAGLNPDNRPEICVVDNGPGIKAENMDEIFVPFFTTRQSGSGIGLSLSRQIMRIHGGNLRVRSVQNKETIFCLSF